MKRPWGPILAVFVLAGCRTPAQPNDPFLYRSTIPPPGTLTAPGAPGAQPYYPSTGTPVAVPGPAPPLVTPGVAAPPPQAAPVPVNPTPMGPIAGKARGSAEQLHAARRLQFPTKLESVADGSGKSACGRPGLGQQSSSGG